MKRILQILLVSLIVLIIILFFNTLQLKPIQEGSSVAVEIPRDDTAALHLSEAIQIKTISFGDTLPIDTAEFLKFRAFMEKTYPLMHSKLDKQSFNQFSYVFKWKGKDTSKAPFVLMAHLDVVPVEAIAESKWTYPSFSGMVKEDTIWGRGAVDDKSSAIAIMEATEQLLRNNFTPERTFYICFGHDEEIAGKRGANIVSQWFKENNIRPAFVLDEGGMIDTEKFKDVKKPVAVIATGEKGFVNVDISVTIPGGHSSQPEKETAIDVLNKAIIKVRATQMPPIITPPLQSLLERTAAEQSFLKRMIVSNMWLFKNVVIKNLEENKQTNAMVHTTLVPTIVKAGIKDNVIPSIANATFKMEASSSTPSDHPTFKMLESITKKIVPNVLVSPYLMIGATDSRYYRPFSEAVLNFTPMQNAKGFHGIDERIGIADLSRMISFYKLLLAEK
ncbi:MAG: M20/M25/M40 family metallo-hydrolase [Chitinophagia bacterium]|nr:M20/M25/M40 family metallo-hydrolase [Chitinophagia bacterium]